MTSNSEKERVEGSAVIVIERTYTGEVFEWDGVITKVDPAFIETKHRRNAITHPQWMSYNNAYSETWTKHYLHPDGLTPNIKYHNQLKNK